MLPGAPAFSVGVFALGPALLGSTAPPHTTNRAITLRSTLQGSDIRDCRKQTDTSIVRPDKTEKQIASGFAAIFGLRHSYRRLLSFSCDSSVLRVGEARKMPLKLSRPPRLAVRSSFPMCARCRLALGPPSQPFADCGRESVQCLCYLAMLAADRKSRLSRMILKMASTFQRLAM